MDRPFPPFDPDGPAANAKRRFRDIPLRAIFPTMLTLLAICSGLTSIRFSAEARFDLAVAAIIFAAALDGIDGRVARFLKSTSRFGAQMDSLADFVNFGVAPAMMLFFAITHSIGPLGWISALIFAICTGLRLARFNVMIDEPGRPIWLSHYFLGVPAPAGALIVMVPVYAMLLGSPQNPATAALAAIYMIFIGLLMVSSLPTFSGKEFGRRVPRDYAMPLMIGLVVSVALLFSYPWETLLLLSCAYIVMLPIGYRSWRRHIARDQEAPRQAAQ
jgi:CDP-diacylglycerol---serine O-phosphatidyltransferase